LCLTRDSYVIARLLAPDKHLPDQPGHPGPQAAKRNKGYGKTERQNATCKKQDGDASKKSN
jgi:hypothetical protein